MNQRNVEALELILVKRLGKSRTFREEAELLASHGVLVPSALTDEEASRAVCGMPGVEQDWEASPDQLRAELERIAKGESAL